MDGCGKRSREHFDGSAHRMSVITGADMGLAATSAATLEAELVAAARAGQEAAVRELTRIHNQRLFRVARAITADDAEAEDVVQEAYVKAFTKLDHYRGEAALGTWLVRIVINEARSRLRRRRPTVELSHMDEAQGPSGAQVIDFPGLRVSDPEADAARSQMRGLLEGAVDALPEAFRTVFILREVEELSVEETADQLELKPETVRTRLHRARRLLRKALQAQLQSGLAAAYPFLGARCEAMTEKVVSRLRTAGTLAG
jgi:RNA polymerase sigma-70 factor (ECF subfamily)